MCLRSMKQKSFFCLRWISVVLLLIVGINSIQILTIFLVLLLLDRKHIYHPRVWHLLLILRQWRQPLHLCLGQLTTSTSLLLRFRDHHSIHIRYCMLCNSIFQWIEGRSRSLLDKLCIQCHSHRNHRYIRRKYMARYRLNSWRYKLQRKLYFSIHTHHYKQYKQLRLNKNYTEVHTIDTVRL